jgi:hypothetical protein
VSVKRECGDCQLCCKLLPTKEVPTLAGERCKHQRHGVGCAIYPNRPLPCQLWSCRWLINDDTTGLRRPDRSRYVIDMLPDFVEVDANDGTPVRKVEAIQIWCDPKDRNAHRDPALRRYLWRQWVQRGAIGLVRFSAEEGLSLVPMSDGTFIEHHSENTGRTHSVEDLIGALGNMTVVVER